MKIELSDDLKSKLVNFISKNRGFFLSIFLLSLFYVVGWIADCVFALPPLWKINGELSITEMLFIQIGEFGFELLKGAFIVLVVSLVGKLLYSIWQGLVYLKNNIKIK